MRSCRRPWRSAPKQSGVKRASTDPIDAYCPERAGGGIRFIWRDLRDDSQRRERSPQPVTAPSVGRLALWHHASGWSFRPGLIMVIVGGAELFTGNNLIVMAWASGKVTTRALLLNWVVSFAGNFVGAIRHRCADVLHHAIYLRSRLGRIGGAEHGQCESVPGVHPRVDPGICAMRWSAVAVWMCLRARTNIDRVVTAMPPISRFRGGRVRTLHRQDATSFRWDFSSRPERRNRSGRRSARPRRIFRIDLEQFSHGKLVPVTIGNIIGGSVMVFAVYWFVYLRKAEA